MNILEGLRRIFVAAGVVLALWVGEGAWTKSVSSHDCTWGHVGEEVPAYIEKKANGPIPDWAKCPSRSEISLQAAWGTAMVVSITLLSLLAFWLVLRWILLGFFPGLRHK